ncbi:MAG: hypothetical protein JRI66_04605 [Deltaproteobacteria bacterium]|nr:hypothetical protein [Deltaproteobacteria bacterium]
MTKDFPYDLVTLRDFDTGWGWDAQLRGLIRKKYRQDLEGLSHLNPSSLAQSLRAEVLPEQPYASVQWVIRICPFRPLELYFLYDHDPEFGTDLRVFYARKSLAVPTEDAYVFAWDFLGLLARYGRGTYVPDSADPGSSWVPFEAVEARVGASLKDFALGPRLEVVPLISTAVAAVAMLRLDSGTCVEMPRGWVATWPVLQDLSLRLRVELPDIQVAFDDRGAIKYPPEFLLSFAWLYINALIRQARQVEPSLPRLSRYF